MEVKTYRVKTMPEALQVILADLGPQAAVLHTRKRTPPFWQFWQSPYWEVVAADAPEIPDRFHQYLSEASHLPQQPEPQSKGPGEFVTGHDRRTTAAPSWGPAANEAVQRPPSPPTTPTDELTWGSVREQLSRAGVTPQTANRLIRELGGVSGPAVSGQYETLAHQPLPAWGKLVERLGQTIPFPGPLEPPRTGCFKLALVGPTGVGKTTTLAKLAADFHLRQGLRVGLITLDTFRVGAIDQLQAYAQILELPLRVVANAREMAQAIDDLAECDLVMIDTLGRSPRDRSRIQDMQPILAAAQLDHVLLTLSATSETAALRRALQAFRPLGSEIPLSLIVTKVDEVHNLAHLYPVLSEADLPWRYWTNGQSVPEDLGVADPDVVAWFLDQVEFLDDRLASPSVGEFGCE